MQTFLKLGFFTTIMHINWISNTQKIIETFTGTYVDHLETIHVMKYSLKIVASHMQMGMHECIMLPHGDIQSLKGSYTTARHRHFVLTSFLGGSLY